MTALTPYLHLLETETMVELFELDLSNQGGGVERWTTTETPTALVWQGVSFPYIPMKVSGFELVGQGQLPRPKIEISNVDSDATALVRQYGDLVGAIVTRIRTMARFLDNGSTPDPTAILPTDVYRIEQKTGHNNEQISWELSAYLDVASTMIPKRQVLRDTCMHTYRTYVSGTGASAVFSYTNATCPYTYTAASGAYFDRNGTATTAALDKCGKRFPDCNARIAGFPDGLPTRAFPGVARVR